MSLAGISSRAENEEEEEEEEEEEVDFLKRLLNNKLWSIASHSL